MLQRLNGLASTLAQDEVMFHEPLSRHPFIMGPAAMSPGTSGTLAREPTSKNTRLAVQQPRAAGVERDRSLFSVA